MSKSDKKIGTFIHGIGASQHLDSSGERIDIKGIDISSLTKDGVLNYEHKNDNATQIVGKIIEAKKILKESDCTNDQHRYFWEQAGEVPYLYIKGELFDAVGHQGAKDVAAMLRYDEQGHRKKESKNLINFSIEGSTLEKQGSLIKKCIARKVTITITPCNKKAIAELYSNNKKVNKSEKNFKFTSLKKNEKESGVSLLKAGFPVKYKPKRVFSAGSAPDKIRVGDRIIHSQAYKPLSGKQLYTKGPDMYHIHHKEKGQLTTRPMTMRDIHTTFGHPDKLSEKGLSLKPYTPPQNNIEKAKSDKQLSIGERSKAREDRKNSYNSTYTPKDAKNRLKIKQKMKLDKYDSNVRKATIAGSMMGSPSTATQGGALQKETIEKDTKKIAKSISDEAFAVLPYKKELLTYVWKRFPSLNKKEKVAIAKTIAYKHLKKKEESLNKLLESLEKADIFDFKTGKLLHSDNPKTPNQSQDIPRNPKTPKQSQDISQKSVKEPHPADLALGIIKHRFGTEGHKNLLLAMKLSEQGTHSEPYGFGDPHNIMHGKIRAEQKEKGLWNKPIVLPIKVNDVKGHLGKFVAQGGADPFAWIDSRYGLSKHLLKQYKDKPLEISTRSNLIATPDYIKHLNPNLHKVNIHVLSDNEKINKRIEPGAPSYKRRIEAAKALKAAGIPVTIIHDKVDVLPEEYNTISDWSLSNRFPIKENKIKAHPNSIRDMEAVLGTKLGNKKKKSV